MTEITDAGIVYLVTIGVAIIAAAGAGWYVAEQLSTVITAIILLLLGYFGGIHVASNNAEVIGFSLLALIVVTIFAYMLPITVLGGLALFIVGYLLGMQTERRG